MSNWFRAWKDDRACGRPVRFGARRYSFRLPCVGADANQSRGGIAQSRREFSRRYAEWRRLAHSRARGDRRGTQQTAPAAGRYVLLSVTDPARAWTRVSQVFEPFFTTKGVGKGTGLGLSMVQGLAEQSGGKLRISSEINRGTVIEILLPVMSARMPNRSRRPRARRRSTSRSADAS